VDIDPDILDQLRADFPAEAIPEVTAELVAATTSQRILRCIVFEARGHRWLLSYLCRLAKLDWRDVIMSAEYARGDPQLRLYDFNRPIPQARIDHPFGSEAPVS
jgi:hypothetical protein